MPTLKEFTDLSLLHLNTWSLPKNIDDLTQSTKTDFDIIAISESRPIKDKLPPTDVSLTNYSYAFCKTEANADCTLIHIGNPLAYETRNYLNSLELETTFIEICNPKKENNIGCI